VLRLWSYAIDRTRHWISARTGEFDLGHAHNRSAPAVLEHNKVGRRKAPDRTSVLVEDNHIGQNYRCFSPENIWRSVLAVEHVGVGKARKKGGDDRHADGGTNLAKSLSHCGPSYRTSSDM
jgi:hypothetical protein